MKRKISDMMDGFPVDDVELAHSAPLSSERIKELTMSKVNKPHKGRRLGFRILIAAAIIASLTITAYAADVIFNAGDVLRGILNERLAENQEYAEKNELDVTVRETISEGQVEVVNKLGQNFTPTTLTSEGTTMTLAAAYGDDHVLYLYLQAVAPKGTVLPDDIIYIFYDPDTIDYTSQNGYRPLKVAEGAPYKGISGFVIDVQPLTDADPGDNKKDFYITITAQDNQKAKFNDGISKYLNITGIYQQVPDVNGDKDGYYLLAPGNFQFDIGLVNKVERLELDVADLTYGGHKIESWTHDSECISVCNENLTGETDPETGLPIHSEEWDYSVTAKRLTISPLSAEWEVDFTTSNGRMEYGLEFQIVMKDGSSPLMRNTAMSRWDNKSSGVDRFETPIDFDEIDYILIGDPEINSTHKIYLPN